MKTFYLVDYENINNDERLKNIESLPKTDQVHIFFTEDTPKINTRYAFLEIVTGHKVLKVKKAKNGKKAEIDAQALDKHLDSYLGYLLGVHGKEYAYVIVSEDIGYDNIIKFWKDEGYPNISRKEKIPGTSTNQKTSQSVATTTTQTANSKISEGMAYDFSGEDRSELNQFMQRGLADMRYPRNVANGICKLVVAHCNDERILSGLHNDLKKKYEDVYDYKEIYQDVKTILEKFVSSKSKITKRKS